MAQTNVKDLLSAGVHFGHLTRKWNPNFNPFILSEKNGVHIIDLQQTTPMLGDALKALRDIVSKGGRVLFVGTKRQASEPIAEAAATRGLYVVPLKGGIRIGLCSIPTHQVERAAQILAKAWRINC